MDFFKFISQGKSENYPNLKTLIMLDDKYPGIFDKMLKTFSFKDIKRTTEQNKKNKKMSWQEALTAAYLVKKYANITEETKGLAKLFAKHNLSQEIFDQAVEIHSKAKGVKPHILSKPLKEETILESIEKIKEKTGKSLINAQKQIEELYEKEFTYEMLNKHDTINYIIGLYTNCCATIYSIFNGSSIAKATILSDNVQNIVIRDSEGEIAAKGALYINQAMRYGVINSLIVNEKYREFKKSLGVECNQISQHADKKRELIYNAFIRGVNNFVTAYNLEHPMAPLKKIAVGLNNNSLYSQCSKLKKENKILNVPDMYGFSDAIEQRIIYKKEKKSIFSKPQTEQEM